jgi:predicted ester cyclase
VPPEENKSTLLRYIDEVWGRRSLDGIDRFLAPNYRRHTSPTQPPIDRDGQRNRLRTLWSAFPDAVLAVEAVIADGDHVAFRSRFRGTHRGVFSGFAATGRSVDVQLLDLVRFDGGRIAEQWGGPDFLDLYGQIGAVLVPGPHASHDSWKTLE